MSDLLLTGDLFRPKYPIADDYNFSFALLTEAAISASDTFALTFKPGVATDLTGPGSVS